jgi:hypothetical protein
MASERHLVSAEDDSRHVPGKDSMPLWNESFWFPFYDPASDVGVVFRIGVHPNLKTANVFLFLTRGGTILHSWVDHGLALPLVESRRLVVGSLGIEWLEPVDSFRLRYSHAPHGFDVVWKGITSAYQYPPPPDTTADQVPRHIEHAGRVTGTVTLSGESHRIDCFGHRDHSFGGERDWAKMHRWNYLSGEIDRDFWFNAVRIAFAPDMDFLYIGCLWDGDRLHEIHDVQMEVETTDGGARQTGVDVEMTDEAGRVHRVASDKLIVNCPVLFGRTWLKDAFVEYRYRNRRGHGILEHGFIEQGEGSRS